jgi:hypothetical protein
MDRAAFKEFVVEIVRRIDADPGFKVLPRRWVVDQTFGLLPSSGRQHVQRSAPSHLREDAPSFSSIIPGHMA